MPDQLDDLYGFSDSVHENKESEEENPLAALGGPRDEYVSTIAEVRHTGEFKADMSTISIGTAEWVTRRRSVDIAPSIIRDIDALCYITRRVRLEADPCGRVCGAYCSNYGVERWTPLSALSSVFLHDAYVMPLVVAAAVNQKACGVFIIPVDCKFMGRTLMFPSASSAQPTTVIKLLQDRCLVKFNIPREGIAWGHGFFEKGAVGYLCNFGATFKTASRTSRPETEFNLKWRPGCPRMLPVNPEIPHMASPLFDAENPAVVEDRAPGCAPFEIPEGTVPPRIVPSETRWNVENLRKAADWYPDKVVSNIALSAAQGLYNPFRGDPQKTVVWRDRPTSDEDQARIYDLCAKNTEKGYGWGPLPYCPFPNARLYPAGLAPKHKYDPLCSEFRLVSDLSAGKPLSVNDLTATPSVIYVSLTVQMFCDVCVHTGRGAVFSQGDIPAAFKLNPNNPELLHLFCTKVVTKDRTGEKVVSYFGDCAHCFGWRGAEQCFACQLGLVKWHCLLEQIKRIMWYVDNYYQVHRLQSWDKTLAEIEATRASIHKLGPDLHKCSVGPRGKVLGWDIDLAYGFHAEQVMLLPDDKRAHFGGRFATFQAQTSVSVSDILEILGIVNFLAQGIRVIKCHAACLAVVRENVFAKQKRLSIEGKPAGSKVVTVRMSEACKNALKMIGEVLRSHSGVCPMVQRLGPCTRPSVYIWSDASSGRIDETEPPAGFGTICFAVGMRSVLGYARLFTAEERLQAEGPTNVSSPTLEMLGVKGSLQKWKEHCIQRRVVLGTDAEVTVKGYRSGFSDKVGFCRAIVDTMHLEIELRCYLRVYHLPRTRAPAGICDLLSRGKIQEARTLCLKTFGVPLKMESSA
jgi:hypothetical protein